MTPDEAIRRAQRAEQLLRDDLLTEALDDIEQTLTRAWQESGEHDHEGRERLYRMLRSCKSFRRFLEATIQNGVVEEHTLQAIRQGRF